MSIFSKVFKKGEEEDINLAPGAAQMAAAGKAAPEKAAAPAATASMGAEITRMKAQLEAVGEMRKAMNERFSQISTQIGELRGMVLESGKAMQKVELSTTKAVGLVESIEPDKFFVIIHKQNAKIDALKANIESKEAMLQTVMSELKGMRKEMKVFRGLDQVIKMTDEVKAELTNIRKVKATAERHADKVETFFSEIQKQVRSFGEFESGLKELKDGLSKLTKSIDQMNIRILKKANKKELEALTTNFKEFEDHTFKVIALLNKEFTDVRTDFEHRFNLKFKRAERINRVLQDLVKPSPEFKKNLVEIKSLAELELKQQVLMEARKEARKKPGLLQKVLKRKKPELAEGEGDAGEGEEKKEGEAEEKKEE